MLGRDSMRKLLLLLPFSLLLALPVKADFGDADFPIGMFKDGPKSYHDAWCGRIGNKCRVRFQGEAMWVEGQGGIKSSQYLGHDYDKDGLEHYNYLTYSSENGGVTRYALFLFANPKAQYGFSNAIRRWKNQDKKPYPNFRLPASQGPQDTQGRDKGLNPYDNPPITDWSKKTTKELEEICKSAVYRKRPVCRSYR